MGIGGKPSVSLVSVCLFMHNICFQHESPRCPTMLFASGRYMYIYSRLYSSTSFFTYVYLYIYTLWYDEGFFSFIIFSSQFDREFLSYILCLKGSAQKRYPISTSNCFDVSCSTTDDNLIVTCVQNGTHDLLVKIISSLHLQQK